MPKIDNAEILKAVESLRDEWPGLLGDDAATLDQWLTVTPPGDPEAIRQIVNRILDLLQAHPQATARISSELGIKGNLHQVLRIYEPPPGDEDEIQPGTLMVCPVDPDHYQQRLRQRGQRLYCPDHEVGLVPAHQLPPQE
jgi:hypothetical protein